MGKYLTDHNRFHFEIYRGDKAKAENPDKFYWRLYYVEDIIATGHQGFSTPKACEGQIALVVTGAQPQTEIVRNY